MTVIELIKTLSELPTEKQHADIVFRVECAFHGLMDIDYHVRETNGDRVVLAKEC